MVSGDPWVIQPHEHAKFAEHFRNLNPVNGLVSGEQAKRFMLQSQLPAPILGKIWFLADTNADGKLDLKEFSIACKVINLKLHGVEIPPSLPPSLISSLSPTGTKQPPIKPPMYSQVPPKPAVPPLPSMPSTQQQPVMQPTQPLIPSTQPIQPLIPVSQPGTISAQTMMSASQPLIPTISSTQPILPSAQPTMPSAQPIIPSAQPIIPSAQPIIPSTQPIIPSTQPIIPSTQPIIPSAQPLIPSSQPLIPSMQPLIPASQPLIPDSSASSLLGDLTGPPSQPLISGIPPLIPNLTAQPLAAAPPPLIPPQPVPVTSQPLGLGGQPLIGSIPPLVGSSGPIMASSLMNNGSIIPTTQNSLVSSPPGGIGSLISTNGGVGQPVTSTPIAAAMMKPASELDSVKAGVASPPSDLPMGMVSSMSQEWGLPQAQRLKYTQLFNVTDRTKAGFISGPQARNIMVQSKLPQATLAQIWALADLDSDGKLGCDEFVLAMYLCEIATQGEPVPLKLPAELIPPMFRRDSVGSAASQSSYEERRRENFARGQAELERRRAALADAQTKEKAERERKEREEAEKKERARLEIQRKEQEELKRKQKEEQEKRDAARKEMERQCQLEWEMKRIRELEAMRADEQSKVLALKARSQRLAVELAEKNAKAGDLTREIRETRTGVADLKNTIDGMRSSRDASMQEMSQLKAKVKELNAKQIALNQEKAHLDAKSKTGGTDGSGEDGKLNMMEVTLKQLREKVEAAKALVETKRTDVDGNKRQLAELTDSVTALSDKCQRVWQLYEEKRQLYNERKNAAPVESAWDSAPVTAAWGSSTEPADAWGSAATTESTWGDTGAVSVAPAQPEPVADTAGPRYRCVYEFVARTVDELSLQPGDLVYEPSGPRAAAEPGWRWGQCRGQTGWYPESYVEDIAPGGLSVGAIDPLESKTPLEGIVEVPENVSEVSTVDMAPAAIVQSSVPGATDEVAGETYVAAYSYNSVEPGDLVFEAGEVIQVIARDGDWWTGRIGTRTGIFPSNYVQQAAVTAATAVATATAVTTAPAAAVSDSPAASTAAPTTDAFSAPPVEETPVYSQPVQEAKSSTPVSSEVASITEGAERRAASGATRPGSAARRDSGRDSVTGGPRSGKKQEIAQVLASYTATSAEQLSLQKGQLLIVRKKADSGWWEGELQAKGRNRQQGWFPASYVKVLQASGRTSGRTTPVLSSKIDPMTQDQVIDKVVALYPYTAQNADELSFEKDDIIAVTNRDQDPAWWQGELRGMTGLFPSNYVTKLVHDN